MTSISSSMIVEKEIRFDGSRSRSRHLHLSSIMHHIQRPYDKWERNLARKRKKIWKFQTNEIVDLFDVRRKSISVYERSLLKRQ